MNRKNLTAAVLAGLAGAAGIAGTAQAVNLNPDGLGQVLIYSYYNAVKDSGNDTLLSVVNTSSDAKAVKVRFKEGFNSREVLDFNMYMSAYDVWVAAIVDDDGTPTLLIPDTTCTVPYLYEQDSDADGIGEQAFLDFDYTGGAWDDGGPQGIERAAEGHFEMIEMGTLTGDSAEAATHVIDDDGVEAPADCDQLVDNWSTNPDGLWIDDPDDDDDIIEANIDISRNSGGLFGGAAIINVANGTMFSYDAKAIQGFDKSDDGLHFTPGTSNPSLNSGSENDATLFFGAPRDESVTLHYPDERHVDAISALFMHENSMNEFSIEAGIHAASEWVITFPTKNWYVDEFTINTSSTSWIPDVDDTGCNGWDPGEDYPDVYGPGEGNPGHGNGDWVQVNSGGIVTDATDKDDVPSPVWTDWTPCTFLEIDYPDAPVPPFTSTFGDGGACEPFDMHIWDREESPSEGPDNPGRPIVSPPPHGNPPPDAPNEICYEVNVLRFGNDGVFPSIFGTPTIEGESLLKTVDTGSLSYDNGTQSKPIYSGWASISWHNQDENVLCEDAYCWDYYDDSDEVDVYDFVGLLGLPVTGFWALQFENGYLGTPEASVLSNYGGLFQHKGNVHRSGVNNRHRRNND